MGTCLEAQSLVLDRARKLAFAELTVRSLVYLALCVQPKLLLPTAGATMLLPKRVRALPYLVLYVLGARFHGGGALKIT
jgi:hypothetical protein